MAPLVSVIVPTFNRAATIGDTLRSVLAQTHQDWEVVMVDDFSSDSSVETARSAGLGDRLWIERHTENRGPSAARNTGILSARGRFVAFLDSDDQWLPTKLQTQLDLLQSEPDADMVFCATQTRVVMEGRERIRPERPVSPHEDWSEFLYLADGFAQTSSFVLSRNLANRILFEPRLRQHEDSLFFLKAGRLGAKYLLVEKPLSVWHHDDRPDRLGYSPNLERTKLFVEIAGDLLTTQARLSLEARFIAPLLFRRHPAQAVRAVGRALRGKAIGMSDIPPIVLRSCLSERAINRVRRLIGRKAAVPHPAVQQP